ncbi:hypothetical protein D3C71_1661000 [compost metagenome]
MVKAVSLILVGLSPSERQAISSSRKASQARPSGMRSRRLITNSVSTTSNNATRYKKTIRSLGSYFRPKKLWKVSQPPSRALRLNSRPKKVGFGIWLMPFGPPVISVLFNNRMRTISPNPSVTIAR